jgi:hypothetical protein
MMAFIIFSIVVTMSQPHKQEDLPSAAGYRVSCYVSLLCLWFYIPVIIVLPSALIFAIAWRRPNAILLLRPFQAKRTSKALKDLVRQQAAGFGHIYTLSDRYLRLAWARRAPWLALLPFVAFQQVIRTEHDCNEFERRMSSTFVRTLNWFYSRNKILTINCTDAIWRYCVERLLLCVDVVIIDLSGANESVAWELEAARSLGVSQKLICLTHVENQRRVKWLLAARFGDDFTLIEYDDQRIARTRLAEAIAARAA